MVEGKARVNLDIDTPSFPEAQCLTIEDKDFFFPKEGKQEAERLPQLKQICGGCVHRKECLEYALSREIHYGFWGGKTARERNEAVKPRRIPLGDLAHQILQMHEKGFAAHEIAHRLDTSIGYTRRCISRFATSKGVVQSHQKTDKDSSSSWGLSQ